MLRLKLSAPYEQVYVCISLENPSTGRKLTIDAKVDTGAAVTIIPRSVLEGFGLPTLGKCGFTMVDGTPLMTEAQMCRLSFSDEDDATIISPFARRTKPTRGSTPRQATRRIYAHQNYMTNYMAIIC